MVPEARHVVALVALLCACAAGWWLWPKEGPQSAVVHPAPPTRARPEQDRRRIAPMVRTPIDAGTNAVSLWVIAADTGEPIAGARVLRAKYAGAATSDARGAVVFSWADHELEISAAFMRSREGTFGFGDTVELERLPTVRGEVMVRTDGPLEVRPVAGAEVSTTTPPFTQTVTGPDGKFELTVAAGFGHIGARKDGLFGLGWFNQHEDLEDVFIILEAARFVDGTVVDSKGKPIEGAAVAWSTGVIAEHSLTGPDGKWEVPQWERQVTVSASKAGYLPYARDPSTHWRGQLRTVIQLDRPAALTGVVRTPDGRFVNGATVEGGDGSTISGPEGRFALAGLSPHTNSVEATLGLRKGSAEFALTEEASTAVVVVLPPELIDVPLRLVDGLGAELECHTATATPIPAEGWTSDFAPERKGLLLRAGRFRIEVTAADDHQADVTVDVRPPAPLTITVHRDPNADEASPLPDP